MVGDDPVGHAALDHVVGHVDRGWRRRSGDHVAGAVQLGDRGDVGLVVEEALDERRR